MINTMNNKQSRHTHARRSVFRYVEVKSKRPRLQIRANKERQRTANATCQYLVVRQLLLGTRNEIGIHCFATGFRFPVSGFYSLNF